MVGDECLSDELFEPVVFNVFGDYDFAFLALSDTFQFGAKSFRPYGFKIEDLDNDPEELPFQYQCFYGPHYYSSQSDSLSIDYLKQLSKKECISICQIKLNNALVIGGAIDFLKYTLAKIDAVLKRRKLDGIISLSFSWHEITLVCAADNYIDLYYAAKEVRGLELNELCNTQENKKNVPDWYNNTLHKKYKQEDNNDPITLIKETNTKFGYRYEGDIDDQNAVIKKINKNNEDRLKSIQDEGYNLSGISYMTRIRVKPERAGHLISKISQYKASFRTEHKPRYASGRAVINFSWDRLFSLFSETNIVSHNYIRKISTYLEFYEDENNVESENHRGLQQDIFKKLEINLARIEGVRERCSELHYPKMTTERIMRILVNYNRNISDPAIFSYFLELKGPIDYLLKRIEVVKTTSMDYLEANRLLDELENSFWTRYYHTPQFIYNGDTSTEHSGGILQILSSYDYASRKHGEFAFSNRTLFDERSDHHVIINLTTNPGIKSTEKSIHLNFYHLFQPCLLAATMMHECSNYFPSKIHNKFGNIMNLLTVKKGNPLRWNKESFEYFLNEICELYIYFNKDFSTTDARTTPESDGLYYAFSENGLRILLIDYMTWNFAYNKNTELFMFWHFGSILQDTAQYDSTGRLKKDFFTQFSIRFYLLAYLINKSHSSGKQAVKIGSLTSSLKSIFSDNVEGLDEDLKNYREISKAFLDNCYDLDSVYEDHLNKVKNRFMQHDEVSKSVFIVTFNLLNIALSRIKNKKLAQRETDKIQKILFLDDMKFVKTFILAIDEFEVSFDAEVFIEGNIIYDYLQAIFEETKQEDASIYFDCNYYMRHKNEDLGKISGMQFNSVGGIFTTNREIREFMIVKDSEFYFALWHLAQKDKMVQI